MDEEIERLVVSVRADTGAFARDVATMRGEIETGLGAGVDRAGRLIENALMRAIRTGKLGFDDLRQVALAAMAQIAAAAIQQGVAAASGGGGAAGSLAQIAGAILTSAMGAPGRATGGPVSPGAAYLVGERGPELFVPTSSGEVRTMASGAGRDVRVSITVNASGGGEGQALARSGRQVARVVRAALMAAER
jgi:phage-related minor tail protein